MSTSHSYNGVKWIYISTDSEYISNKMKKIHRVLSNVIMDEDVTRYLPRMDRLRFQGILCFVKVIRHLEDSTCKDLQTSEFKIRLSSNQFINLNRVFH